MLKKIIKYLFNLAFIFSMIWFAYFYYEIIVRVPESRKLLDLILSQIKQVFSTYFISILIITLMNFLYERKIEKKKFSYEFLKLLLIHLLIIIFALIYYSIDFYNSSILKN